MSRALGPPHDALKPVLGDAAAALLAERPRAMVASMVEQPRYLSGKLLLAMPGMADPRFERAVIALCVHDENGAIGIGIGHKRAGIGFRGLLKQLEIDPGEAPDVAVHHGGPVEPGRGFVLHSTDWGGQDTLHVAGPEGMLFAMTARSKRGSAIPGIASSSLPDRKFGCSDIVVTMGRSRAAGKA